MYKVEVLNELKTPLVNKFYKKHSVRGRANKQDKVWVTYYNNEIVAACRLQDKTEFLFLNRFAFKIFKIVQTRVWDKLAFYSN